MTTDLDVSAPVKVGLVGAGMMGMTHSLAWTNVSSFYWPHVQPVTKLRLADATAELAEAGAHRLGWNEATGNWREVTAADDVDVVDIVVPNSLHHDIAIDAFRHGKHVFCEKPLSMDLGEAREMYAEAERAGVVHQTGFVYRSFPGVVLARKLIADGKIGDVRYFRGQWLSDWAADPSLPFTWRFERATAGAGVLADTGSHVLDLARFLVGDEISRVLARSKTFIAKRPLADAPGAWATVDTDDLTDMMVEFDGGAIGSICLARAYPGHNTDMGFEVVGSEGSVSFSWIRPNELNFYSMRDPEETRGMRTILIGKNHPNSEAFWGRGITIGFTDAFLIQFRLMLEALRGGSTGRATFLDGLRNGELIEAAASSLKDETWVDVDRYEPS